MSTVTGVPASQALCPGFWETLKGLVQARLFPLGRCEQEFYRAPVGESHHVSSLVRISKSRPHYLSHTAHSMAHA
ncbi:hypothetical protein CH63R_06287 [Colletotrichum higginsianum IMI 349063]|uniref:Uncharacterized protein n=1 Tax=Colletotrichum higginsianum (strain IMI 349063) TaxID=759273 RepID=A0A1B7YF32_COLHI|nr:hypothetical protein CH63R_06287 [Colletotrichum higginsianum IMI 349063]OBR10595.1 hypothetical protein CH63R_06287 [Colletotrichum higginsianum IMI 349063]